MEITIDLTFLLNTLIFIASSLNFVELFAIVFCFIVFLTVAKITLNSLAEKKITFSFLALAFYLLIGGAMFALSYTEWKFVGVTFTSLAQVLVYSVSESAALIVLYASFLCFAATRGKRKQQRRTIDMNFYLPKTYKGRIEEVALNDDMQTVRLKTHKANEPKIKVVDIGGALQFVDSQIALGKSNLKPIRDKIAFYSGAELEEKDVLYLNELFSNAVKL